MSATLNSAHRSRASVSGWPNSAHRSRRTPLRRRWWGWEYVIYSPHRQGRVRTLRAFTTAGIAEQLDAIEMARDRIHSYLASMYTRPY